MFYIAYGSNLNVQQMARRCPTAELVGSGIVEGYELLFRGRRDVGFATIEKCDSSQVQVGIWNIKKKDELSLDRYEGFPNLYRKEAMKIRMRNGETMTGMVYIMDERIPLNLPSKEYLSTILKGYTDFDLSVQPLFEAYNHVKVLINQEFEESSLIMKQ